ncbi:uncharacterized protein LOC124924523 [Impatiens glandulifera]|uniref:uncharacterized protein LOC124924523 n=1 Tax=Impatiens glandulifera TaxID=253017 RepID=UPI001FB0913C|nr:uncharacterized protein LOC124924523 [Impatiens glandulifera]
MTQVDFEEIRQKGTPAAKRVIDRVTEAGLEYFLGSPHVLYKEAVEEFFNTATLSGDKITATVCGTEFELTEESVAESLRLPTAGQDAAADIELSTFEAACQILSATKEPIKVSGNKATLRPEYIPICDIFTKAVQARGGNYNSLTKAKIGMLVGLIEGTKVNWAKEVFNNLKDMRKQPALGSTGGRKKKSGKKSAPAKEKAGSKGKEKIVFSEPPSQTEEEESASTSGRTESEKTDDERPNDEGLSGLSPDNTGTGENPENDEADVEGSEEEEEEDQTKADTIARRLLEVITLRAEKVGDIYREWHEYRFTKLYKHILPGFTEEECFKRMKEIEDIVMSLTNAKTIHKALGRTVIIRPRAQLQKLTVRIRKIKERYEEETLEDTLTPLVLERLEKAREELEEEIERLEVMYRQREIPHSPAPRIDKGQTHGATPPRANPVINEINEGTETPFTAQQQAEQIGASELGITEERVKFLLREFADSAVRPLEERMTRTVNLALRFANNTRHTLLMADDRISQVEADYRVSVLEKKNAGLKDRNEKLEADLKALTAQVDELIKAKMNADVAVVEANEKAAKKVQDALNEETRLAKEPPQLTEEEIAERERRVMAKYPGLAESVAAQAAKDAERLDNERQRLEGFASAHKKQKEAPSSSVPAKRKRKSSKKVQVAELLNEVTDAVIESQPDQATHTEEEDEVHLERRPTRQRVSRPDKKKRTEDIMARFNLFDSE